MSNTQQQARILQKLTLRIPASAGNLGPGLDAVGLALGLYANISITVFDKPQMDQAVVSLTGAIKDMSTAVDQSELIYRMMRRLWTEGSDLPQRVRVQVESEIPLGAGLGSTSTTVLGALWASKVLQDSAPARASLIAEGVALEGYPETLAASLLGDFVVCAPSFDGRQYITQQLHWPDKWSVLLVVPPYRLRTAQARAILGKKVALERAVANIQRTAVMVAAITAQDELAFREALHDELHEQPRLTMVPELSELRLLLKDDPIIGCVLSGAGPAIMVVVYESRKAAVKAKLDQWAEQKPGRRPQVLDVPVDRTGMQVIEPQFA